MTYPEIIKKYTLMFFDKHYKNINKVLEYI